MLFVKHCPLFFFTIIVSSVGLEKGIDSPSKEVRSLSELPMTKLMQIKLSLIGDIDDDNVENDLEGRAVFSHPLLSSYKDNSKTIRRHGEWEETGKDTKISKIFQLAVTTLSFLAFGGYLITLIITAIRRNALAANTGNVIVFSNLQSLTKYKRPKRTAAIMDTMLNDSACDKFYQGMIMISEGYVKYTDFK